MSTNPTAPRVIFDGGVDYVSDLTITLLSTRDDMLPETPVKLSILACIRNETFQTKGVIETGKLIFFQI